jgi:cobalt/nickel transport system permease protein
VHRHLAAPRTGPLHRVAPHAKLAATVCFVFAVVATPRDQFWAFGAHAALVVTVATVARIPPAFLARRLTIEVPFLLFAALLPIVGRGPRVDVFGAGLSRAGLWSAWNIVAKGTLGVAASIVLAATTSVPQVLNGLERLRVPRVMVAITAFMIRYVDVIAGDVRRMAIARASRGAPAGWLRQSRALAATAGTLFVRSYERGERVYLAMEARGYAGAMPVRNAAFSPRSWLACSVWASLAVAATSIAWLVR